MNESDFELYPEPLPKHESDFLKKRYNLWSTFSNQYLTPFVTAKDDIKTEREVRKHVHHWKKRPSVLLTDMARMLFEGTHLHSVLLETVHVLKETTSSKGATVYIVDEAVDEIYQAMESYSGQLRVSYKIKMGTNVAAHCAATKEFVKIDDILEDLRFPDSLGNGEVTVKAVLGVPVMTPEDECIAVFILNRDLEDGVYTEYHLRLAIVMCGWIGSTVYQNQQRLTLQKQQELNEYLLDLTKCYFADAITLDKLITDVINFAKIALNAEHGSFYVINRINGELYADCYEEGIDNDSDKLFKKNLKMKLDNENDITTLVALKGVSLNIRNAYNDSRVDQTQRKGYITRSVLCLPIKGVDEILGVLQLANKIKGSCFTKSDEVLFYTFTVYCGFVLSYAQLHNKMKKTNNLNYVYAEMLKQHMQPCVHDFYFVCNHSEISTLPHRFNQFDFYIPESFEQYMPQLILYMFNEVSKDMCENLSLLTKFVLIIQKSYHDHPYHNFHHAFNVTHCIYNIVRRNMDLFTVTELRALIVAAYCHDVDHYGVTNNFLEITNHYLSQLYDESVLENHHYHVTAFIIKFLKIFQNFGIYEFKSFMKEIRTCILATDLATYFKTRGGLYQLCADNSFNWTDDTHRSLLKSIMMTMADLSGLCKPYNTARHLIDNVYKEFYNEGDKEKEMGLYPLSIMDREKTNMIPSDQVQFMTIVVLPCALILAKLLPNCGVLYKEGIKLRDIWQEIHANQGQRLWTLDQSLPEKVDKTRTSEINIIVD